VSLDQALRGVRAHNVYLHPGDALYVPFATGRRVSVLGQVRSPAALPHYNGLRLTQALSEAGGVTEGGDKDDIRLVRGNVDGLSVYRASLWDIAQGHASDVALTSGDVVFVTDHAVEDVGEVVRLVAPIVVVGLTVLTVWLLVAH
jgi:protein involved in polysaccharide export with SLBB domain